MTKEEIKFLMTKGFSLAEVLEIEAGKPAEPEPEAPEPDGAPAEEPAEGEDPEETPVPAAPAPELAAEIAALRQTVKDLQAAALAGLRQPAPDPEKSLEDIVAAM